MRFSCKKLETKYEGQNIIYWTRTSYSNHSEFPPIWSKYTEHMKQYLRVLIVWVFLNYLSLYNQNIEKVEPNADYFIDAKRIEKKKKRVVST